LAHSKIENQNYNNHCSRSFDEGINFSRCEKKTKKKTTNGNIKRIPITCFSFVLAVLKIGLFFWGTSVFVRQLVELAPVKEAMFVRSVELPASLVSALNQQHPKMAM